MISRLTLSFLIANLIGIASVVSQGATPGHPARKRSPVRPESQSPNRDTGTKARQIPPRADEPDEAPRSTPRINASIASSEINEFSSQSSRIKKLLGSSLELASQNISYRYGSADPRRGLDCSGFIHYVLHQNGIESVPRSSSELYIWARKAGTFRAVLSQSSETFELNELRPGDLMFWIGTYETSNDPPVSHTMIYLGTEKSTGNRIMVGSSDGRTYRGKARYGASIFDFKMPRAKSLGANRSGNGLSQRTTSRFIGYARIPGI